MDAQKLYYRRGLDAFRYFFINKNQTRGSQVSTGLELSECFLKKYPNASKPFEKHSAQDHRRRETHPARNHQGKEREGKGREIDALLRNPRAKKDDLDGKAGPVIMSSCTLP